MTARKANVAALAPAQEACALYSQVLQHLVRMQLRAVGQIRPHLTHSIPDSLRHLLKRRGVEGSGRSAILHMPHEFVIWRDGVEMAQEGIDLTAQLRILGHLVSADAFIERHIVSQKMAAARRRSQDAFANLGKVGDRICSSLFMKLLLRAWIRPI
jgi:hypothetical protein